jgi:hypothetical protein
MIKNFKISNEEYMKYGNWDKFNYIYYKCLNEINEINYNKNIINIFNKYFEILFTPIIDHYYNDEGDESPEFMNNNDFILKYYKNKEKVYKYCKIKIVNL